jgi:hypothetical protein
MSGAVSVPESTSTAPARHQHHSISTVVARSSEACHTSQINPTGVELIVAVEVRSSIYANQLHEQGQDLRESTTLRKGGRICQE